MKTTAIRRWTALLLTAILALSLAAPALAAEPDPDPDPDLPSGAKTEISVRDTVQLDPGQSIRIDAAVTGNDERTRLSWTSQNTSVVTTEYNTDGLADFATLRAVKPGVTKVTVKANDSGFTCTINVTVNGIGLLKGDTLTVPENGSVTWTRGTHFELYGDAAADNTLILLRSGKGNVAVHAVDRGRDKWVFDGRLQGGAKVTAQAYTALNVAVGSPTEITVTVEENTATTITPPGTYSTANPLCFASIESQIAAQCRDMIQESNNNLTSISNVTVSPSEGTLYLGYKDADTPGAGVGAGMTYYVSTSGVGPYLKDIYFVPNPRFTGNTATITFTGNSAGGRTFKGKIAVSVVSGSASASVSLSTAENTPLKLTATPFSTAFRQVSGGAPLQSLTFFLPSELQGTLYRDYVSENNYAAKLTASDRFTQSELGRVTFVPAKGYVGPVVIGFAGYTAAGQRYNGQLTVTVKQSVDGGITYNDGGLGQITFKESDFEDYCQRLTGGKLGWVSFTLPAASQGTLYYNYGAADASKIMVGDVFPYQGVPNISFVTMVPAEGFAGTAKILFNGASESGATFTGTVDANFQSTGFTGDPNSPGGVSGMDVVYTCLPGSSVKLSANDFNNLSQSLTGQRLHYIAFQSLPDHTLGALYHNRTSAGSIGSRAAAGTKYYNSATPYLMNLSFWATESFHGDVEIPFTGASVSGQTFSGSLIITTGTTHTYNATITYNTAGRSAAAFVASQFDSLCRTATNSALNYIRFTSLPTATQGNVYFDYQRAGTPSTITTSDSYYLSGDLSISRLSFLPAPGFTGTVSIPFTGWAISGAQFQGTVQVSVSGGVSGTTVLYTTSGSPVRLSAYDFSNVGGGQPVNISFTSMPYESQGKLYYQYTNPTHYSWLATAGMQYGLTSDPLLANLTFIPKAGYEGIVKIPYTATNTNGGTYTGEVQIAVEPSTISKYFNDLSSQSAATVAAVDFLYSQGVVNGVRDGQYAPASNIRRGDFCLMLYRAYQLSSDGTTAGFRDVPDTAYYAQAVNVLRSQGIVRGIGGNTFKPNASISRQDAALMVQRTLQAAGMKADNGTAEALAGYSDAAYVDAYAQGAVTCLLQKGIMPTNGNSISPRGALTRAAMAVLLHRAIAS